MKELIDYIITRIEPTLHGFELDGYDKTIEHFKRQLEIVLNDYHKSHPVRTQKYTSIEYINKVQELIDKFLCGEKSEIGLKNGLLDLLIDVRDIELQQARKEERKELLKRIVAMIHDLEYVQGDLGKIVEVFQLIKDIQLLEKE